jgi:hypothetical protein
MQRYSSAFASHSGFDGRAARLPFPSCMRDLGHGFRKQHYTSGWEAL